MIDQTFAFIVAELNGFLDTRFPSNEPHAVLSSVLNLDGTLPTGVENKLILTLVNIEPENVGSSSGVRRPRLEDGGLARPDSSLNFSLYLLVSAYFANNYAESLKFISSALAFFEGNPVFTPQSAAAFPRGLEKLSVDMVSLDFEGWRNLWTRVGANYLPSVLYKVRMLPGTQTAGADGQWA